MTHQPHNHGNNGEQESSCPVCTGDFLEGVEVNGASNIVTLIDCYLSLDVYAGQEVYELLGKIKKEAYKTIKYINCLQNPKGIKWHDIKGE